MGLLATGTVEGGLSAGTTAYTIPKIDEYLKEQGFDKEVRDTLYLPYQQALVQPLATVQQVLLTMWGRQSGII